MLLLTVVLAPAACNGGTSGPSSGASASSAPSPAAKAAAYTYSVVSSYPHDKEAFTQGLAIHEGVLYEGTGLVGRSSLRRVRLETGEVIQRRDLPPPYFGEGIAVLGDRIFQLTWQSRKGFIYDRATFEPRGEFAYETEGWGLTTDGKRLIMSDGTAALRFLDPATLSVTGTIQVRDEGVPVTRLNELEYVRGEVYANVWQTDTILRIDAQTGRVTGRVDLTSILGAVSRDRPPDVLNGIAYDSASDRLFVTGKLWPRLFEIKLVPTGNGGP